MIPTAPRRRWCPECEVWGASVTCWCCGAVMQPDRLGPRWAGTHHYSPDRHGYSVAGRTIYAEEGVDIL